MAKPDNATSVAQAIMPFTSRLGAQGALAAAALGRIERAAAALPPLLKNLASSSTQLSGVTAVMARIERHTAVLPAILKALSNDSARPSGKAGGQSSPVNRQQAQRDERGRFVASPVSPAPVVTAKSRSPRAPQPEPAATSVYATAREQVKRPERGEAVKPQSTPIAPVAAGKRTRRAATPETAEKTTTPMVPGTRTNEPPPVATATSKPRSPVAKQDDSAPEPGTRNAKGQYVSAGKREADKQDEQQQAKSFWARTWDMLRGRGSGKDGGSLLDSSKGAATKDVAGHAAGGPFYAAFKEITDAIGEWTSNESSIPNRLGKLLSAKAKDQNSVIGKIVKKTTDSRLFKGAQAANKYIQDKTGISRLRKMWQSEAPPEAKPGAEQQPVVDAILEQDRNAAAHNKAVVKAIEKLAPVAVPTARKITPLNERQRVPVSTVARVPVRSLPIAPTTVATANVVPLRRPQVAAPTVPGRVATRRTGVANTASSTTRKRTRDPAQLAVLALDKNSERRHRQLVKTLAGQNGTRQARMNRAQEYMRNRGGNRGGGGTSIVDIAGGSIAGNYANKLLKGAGGRAMGGLRGLGALSKGGALMGGATLAAFAAAGYGVQQFTQALMTGESDVNRWIKKITGFDMGKNTPKDVEKSNKKNVENTERLNRERAAQGKKPLEFDPVTGDVKSKVVAAEPGVTTVQNADGSVEQRTGARNWRNNNPGNIEAGKFANSMGAIGTDGRFAVFPDYKAGRNAKEKLIFEGVNYRNKNLSDTIARYAPPGENNTAAYQKTVLAAVDNKNLPMSQYTPEQRKAIMDAMEKVEGFKVGKVKQLAPASAPAIAGAVLPPPQVATANTPQQAGPVVPPQATSSAAPAPPLPAPPTAATTPAQARRQAATTDRPAVAAHASAPQQVAMNGPLANNQRGASARADLTVNMEFSDSLLFLMAYDRI